ncbi:MAG TPA: hypothetical protein VHR47_02580 [Bacillota bacterium]|nr:hypothetical protein [Bacillota bacterium]
MKVDGFVGAKINITERREEPSLPQRIEGRLTLSENGQLLLKTHDGHEFPVRLMGIDLPLGQAMSFELTGKEGMTLIYSAKPELPEMNRLESLLQSWGIDADELRCDLMTALYEEGMPLTKDNVLALERNLRLVRQEWGVLIKPRILAMMMAKGLPIRPQTLLAMLYRTTPEMRQAIAKALQLPLAEMDLQTTEGIEKALQNIKDQVHSSDNHNIDQLWQAALGTIICRTEDQGEIHWPTEESLEDDNHLAEQFRFDLIPPHIGLVEVHVEWAPSGSKVTLTVEPDYLELFRKAIPAWQNSLFEQGVLITATAKAAATKRADLPPTIDWRA